ncbi:MAG TPA: hypothetical protein VM434_09475 [Beijerinckiaceae bacterium]|nr:hypothetical protein [Beijerinckiaceae bacterium]
MADPRRLERFLAAPHRGGAHLILHGDGDEPIAFDATFEQLRDLAETLHDLLENAAPIVAEEASLR